MITAKEDQSKTCCALAKIAKGLDEMRKAFDKNPMVSASVGNASI